MTMSLPLAAPLLALSMASGVYLTYSAWAYGWRHVLPARSRGRAQMAARIDDLLTQAGLARARPIHVGFVCVCSAAAGWSAGYAIYGGWLAAFALGLAACAAPLGYLRNLRARRREEARDVWPLLLERVRIGIVSMGRSVPQAVFAAAQELDGPMRAAFDAAHREWLISTDFSRTLDVLTTELADPIADVVSETLLIAHSVGGQDVGTRLRGLIDDRAHDVQARRDARAKQAGVRFARLFVLLVPFGMAGVGLLIGDGRAAYATPAGQVIVLAGLLIIGVCWLWAGRLLQLPDDRRIHGVGAALGRNRVLVSPWRRK